MEGDMEQGVDCWGAGGVFKNRWYGMGLHWTPDCFTAQVGWGLHTAPATVTALLWWGDWPCSKKKRLLGTTTQRVMRELACGHPDVTVMGDWTLKKSVIYLPVYWSLYTGEVWDYWRHGLRVKRRFDHQNPLVHKICEICLIAAWMKEWKWKYYFLKPDRHQLSWRLMIAENMVVCSCASSLQHT